MKTFKRTAADNNNNFLNNTNSSSNNFAYNINHKSTILLKLLDGLGKPTKRGVRQCPKCGYVNGLRGFQCKNKSCAFRFKNELVVPAENDKSLFDVDKFLDTEYFKKTYKIVKLVSSDRFYSVQRLVTDECEFRKEDWGFVYLPFSEHPRNRKPIDDIVLEDFENFQKMANCSMTSCENFSKDSRTSLYKKHKIRRSNDEDMSQPKCEHIKAAYLSAHTGTIFPINRNVLDTVYLPMETKIQLTKLLVNQSDLNVIVQRVSDHVFVVRINSDFLHPLGFSHVHVTGISGESESETLIGSNDLKKNFSLKCWCGLSLDLDFFKDSTYQPCTFLFACLLALSSSSIYNSLSFPLLSEMDEYYNQVNMVQESMFNVDPINSQSPANGNEEDDDPITRSEDVLEYLKSLPKNDEDKAGTSQAKESFQLQDVNNSNNNNNNINAINNKNNKNNTDIINKTVISSGNNFKPSLTIVKRISNKGNDISGNNANNIVNNNISDINNSSIGAVNSVNSNIFNNSNINTTGLNNNNKLANVIHIKCKPRPLHLLTPQNFFDVVHERISHFHGLKKKRLPDSILTVSRYPPTDTDPPFGQFLQYMWNLKDPKHVQYIFSTSTNKFDLSQLFIENKDGTYSKYEPQIPTTDSNNPLTNSKPIIRPLHLKTQLEIGFNKDYKLSKPFIIEWMPDFYPKSKVGRLVLKYEFSHYNCARPDETIEMC
ncbi:hypothetical protein HELRODRAFT_189088 [Helobdella robusta]|uniref:Putative treble-clef zinc-finger domain-containing protein n=1 Tax=Helobdella robusta TaxID=6412 RepID=T1FQM5_HELRO|nr:hypothetical protein HELRODRAFT_189088 [Helobdella robusta]ESN96050.1 hypothetical protein HELRODRAFT_189088 [Helobdella robusta]